MPQNYPTTAEISHIVRNRVYDPSLYIGSQFCPVTPEYVLEIQYDVLEPSFGMTRAHNVGSNPPVVTVPIMGTKRFGTAYWKDTIRINEKELLYARQAGNYNVRAGRDLIVMRSVHLDTRLATRLEWLRWQAVMNGKIVVNDNGVNYTVTYNIPPEHILDISGDASAKWSATTIADPISNLMDWILMYRGTGATPTTVYLNTATAKTIAVNKTVRDLLKNTALAGKLSMANITDALEILIPNVKFAIYDGGYLDETKSFKLFIPDGQVVIVGSYPSEKMMDFVSTISLHNGGIDKPQPGKFAIVEDESVAKKNPHIDITVGIYGLPRIFHPDWIISAKVF